MLTHLLNRQSGISVILVLLLALGLKISLFFIPLPWMNPAIAWSMVGTRWISGHTLYAEIYTTLDPLAAFFYGIFGTWTQSSYFHLAGSSIFYLFIAFYYNHLLNKHKVFARGNYVPAILLIVCSSIYPDQLLLSPALIGAAIILPAADMMITHFRQEQKEEYFFRMGILVGIASLFYHGYWMMLIMFILVTVLFTVSSPRKIVLLVLGAVFPLLLFAIYYFWINNLSNWYTYNISYWFSWPDHNPFAPINLVKISIVPGILLLFSFFALMSVRFIHFQYRVLQLHITWLIFSIFIFLFNTEFGLFNSIVFWVPTVYFISHLFMVISNGFIRETLFLSSVSGILVIFFYVLIKGDDSSKRIFVTIDPIREEGKILLLSDSLPYAINNTICGPYLEWSRFNKDFKNLDNYASLSHIYGTIHNEKPTIIIDEDAYIPMLMKRIPEIEKNYYSENGLIYRKKQFHIR